MSALPRTGASSPTTRQKTRQKTRQTPPEARSAAQASECGAHSDATLAGSPDALQTPDATPAPVAAQLAPLAALAHLTDTLPMELLEAPRWIVFELKWSTVKGERKLKKTPHNARTGELASSTDASTWSTFGEAYRACERGEGMGRYVLGYALGDGVAGVDLDKCRASETGELTPDARAIVRLLDSYTEASPSGTGVHVLLRGALPDASRGRRRGPVEMYSDARFFTITGAALADTPRELRERTEALAALHARTFSTDARATAGADRGPTGGEGIEPASSTASSSPASGDADMSDSAVLARAMRATDGARFARLWSGDSGEYDGDDSRADMALVAKLRFYTRGDASQIDRLFRQSGRMRPKWDARHYADGASYGAETIREALAGHYDVWTPRRLRIVGGDSSATGERIGERQGETGEAATAPDTTPYRAFELTEFGNRDRLLAAHGEDIRYNNAWGFVVWDGKRWRREDAELIVRGWIDDMIAGLKLAASDLARQSALTGDTAESRALAAEAAELLKWAARSQTDKMVKAVLSLTTHKVAAPTSAFDSAPMLFNCANGTIDLRTGALHPHNRADMLTQMSPIAYDPQARAPRWGQFITEIMCGDSEMAAYLQRGLGYSITGETYEQVWHLLIGEGENGKGRLVDTVSYVMGDYAGKLNANSIIMGAYQRSGADASPDMADLKGKRFVKIAETPDGARINAALIKELSGEDPITARQLRREFFTFQPTHKLWIHTNHEPQSRDTGHGYWRRVRKMPFRFNALAHPGGKDPQLAGKLQAEAPGILAWLVVGCLAWQRAGLNPPASVAEATNAMRASQDALRAFLVDNCKREAQGKASASELYTAYKTWATESGERPISQTRFGLALRERGFTSSMLHGRGQWHGLYLLDATEVTNETVASWNDTPAPGMPTALDAPTPDAPYSPYSPDTVTYGELADAEDGRELWTWSDTDADAAPYAPIEPDAPDDPPDGEALAPVGDAGGELLHPRQGETIRAPDGLPGGVYRFDAATGAMRRAAPTPSVTGGAQ